MAVEREIKTVLTLEDASFRKGLKAATSSVSAARAEMQASVASASGLTKGLKKFGAQVTGLNKVIKAEKSQLNVLKKEYDQQKKKLAEATKELVKAKKEHAENSKEVQKAANAYAVASANADDLRVKMANLNSQIARDKDGLHALVTGPLKTFAKVSVAAVAAAGAALVKLTLQSDEAEKSLKRSLAETETKFGVWSHFIIQEADNAWKNVGLSKDKYLGMTNEIGDYLIENGAPLEDAAKAAAELIEDLAWISKEYGVPIAEVWNDVKVAADGNRTALQRYGIQLTGFSTNTASANYQLTDEQKRLAAVKEILEQSDKAQEDYTGKTNDIASATSELNAAWTNFLSGAGSGEDVGKAAADLVITWCENIASNAGRIAVEGSKAAGVFLRSLKLAFENRWNNAIWPAIQEFMKAKFSIDLPDWQTVKANIEEGWNTIKTTVSDFFKGKYKIEMPNWSTIKSNIAAGWAYLKDQAKDWFKKWYGIELPNWTTIKNNIAAGWAYLKDQAKDWFKSTFGLDFPGLQTIKQNISDWWDIMKDKVSGIVSTLFGVKIPSLADIKQNITDWWNIMVGKVDGIVSTLFTIKFPTWDEIAAGWDEFWGNVYNNLPQWLKDIMSFFGLGNGGEDSPAQVSLSEFENSVKELTEAVDAAAAQIAAAGASAVQEVYKYAGGAAGGGTFHAIKDISGSDGNFHNIRGFAGGAWNIPFDRYIARLHAGEMVLTADQARRYRAMAASGGNTYNDSAAIYIDKYNQYSGADADGLLQMMQAMQRRQRMGYGLG